MIKEKINKAIQDPGDIHNLTKDELIALINKYPFCASLHLISTKLLFNENSPDYQSQLAHTAAYANDRKALFRLIYDTEAVKDSATTVITNEPVESDSELVASLLNTNTETDISEKFILAQTESTSQDMAEPEKEEHTALEELEAIHNQQIIDDINNELNRLSETGSGELDINRDVVELENENEFVDEHVDPEMESNRQIINQVDVIQFKEEKTEIETPHSADSLDKVDDITTNLSNITSENIDDIIANLEHVPASADSTTQHNTKDSIEPIIIHPLGTEPGSLADSVKKSFTDWLKTYGTNVSTLVTKPASRVIQISEEAISEVEPINTVTPSKEAYPKIQEDTDDLGVLDHQYQHEQALVYFKETEEDLNRIIEQEIKQIDEFVQNQPAIPDHTVEYEWSVADLARKSLDDSQEVITETMARILVSQGKNKRAIDILEKLVLLHPEKSLYFAGLIKEFKKNSN